jgi:hypothetical protein
MDEKINYENYSKRQRRRSFVVFLSKFWNYFFDPVFEKFNRFLKEILKILKLKFKIFYIV